MTRMATVDYAAATRSSCSISRQGVARRDPEHDLSARRRGGRGRLGERRAPQTVEHNGKAGDDRDLETPHNGPDRCSWREPERATSRPTARSTAGVDKAVYAYAREDYEWWSAELGSGALEPGTFGENLDRHRASTSTLPRWASAGAWARRCSRCSEPRFPCFKLGIRMGDATFLKRFAAARRPGAYLRIIEEGELRAGDRIEIVDSPGGRGDDRPVRTRVPRRSQPPRRATHG